MTVICTLISEKCTIHVTDSNLSAELWPNSYKVVEDKRSKILSLPLFDGAMSYFGFAKNNDFDLYAWFQDETKEIEKKYGKGEAEKFAVDLTKKINDKFEERKIQGTVGLGIHLSAYEKVGDDLIPELFYIHNWTGGYLSVAPSVICQRHSYFTTIGETGSPAEEHKDERYRKSVQTFLRDHFLCYNNGNPNLFNPFAIAFFNVVQRLDTYGFLKDKGSVQYLANLALMPVQSVCESMRQFADVDKQIIGGKIHRVIIEPGKEPKIEEF